MIGPSLVERASVADEPGILRVAERCGVTIDLDAERTRAWTRLWVARIAVGAAPAGFLLAWAVADELHVIDVATDPDLRRRGVGAALVQALLAHARSERVRLVLLEVRRSNQAAIALYRRAGLQPVGLRRDYYQHPAEDAIDMRIEFEPASGQIVRHDAEIDLTEP